MQACWINCWVVDFLNLLETTNANFGCIDKAISFDVLGI
ncbi:hypothetical protein DSM25559_4566 [Agrobacterium rosae]|uniref:Uncharacterized protein n=1 Tax=Agrobacterium rosae TaxID=1972867 RepID=A0A1R3U142_9HYPH|nr:hypothetical protein DSM25559_4566 [Agrobacterium rosae]